MFITDKYSLREKAYPLNQSSHLLFNQLTAVLELQIAPFNQITEIEYYSYTKQNFIELACEQIITREKNKPRNTVHKL